MGEGGEEKNSALSLVRFHLSPFPPETPDTQANLARSEHVQPRAQSVY